MKKTFLLMAVLTVISFVPADSADSPQVIKITAKRFEYNPHEITLKKGVPTTLQLTTEDRSHGFSIPAMNLRADIMPGKITELKVTPQKNGEFDFFCDIFCGSGHEGMNGKITVTD
jgi:cytochrome c oxidase subunit 2